MRQWIDLINESVHTEDDVDIGDIEAVSRNFIIVKRGFVNIHYYYIPVNKVEGWDGHVLWLKVTEQAVKDKYERDKVPDPNFYYLKDYPYYNTMYRPLPLAPSSYILPNYSHIPKLEENIPRSYPCDLCGQKFNSEDELDNHVGSASH